MFRASISDSNLEFFRTDVSDKKYTLTQGLLKKVAGQAGELTFTLPPDNRAYDKKYLKFKAPVRLYRDNKQLFYGRIRKITKQFDGQFFVFCEGIKTILAESMAYPFSYNSTLTGLVQRFLEIASTQTGYDIRLGTVTVEDKNDYVARNYTDYETVIQRLNDLVEIYGGYMDMREGDDDILYLDWVKEYTDVSTQKIEIASNMLDYIEEQDCIEVITHLIPLGAYLLDEDGMQTTERLTIKDAPASGGKIVIDADQDKIDEFGDVYGKMVWDDVTDPAILCSKGVKCMNSMLTPKVRATVSYIDLANCGYNVEYLDIGKKIPVKESFNSPSYEAELVQMDINIVDISASRGIIATEKGGYVSTDKRETIGLLKDLSNESENALALSLITKLEGASQELKELIDEATVSIETNGDLIATTAERIREIDGQINILSSEVSQNSENFKIYFGENGSITSWFDFSGDGFFTIGKGGSEIKSRQDNDSHEFIDASGNVLLRITEKGVDAPTLASNQIKIFAGTPDAMSEVWAIRLGATVNGKQNLDILWIGG